MKHCFIANAENPKCTEHCKDCARDIYHDLKEALVKAEYASESSIIARIGEIAFCELKKYGFLETCGVIDGTKVYAL